MLLKWMLFSLSELQGFLLHQRKVHAMSIGCSQLLELEMGRHKAQFQIEGGGLDQGVTKLIKSCVRLFDQQPKLW